MNIHFICRGNSFRSFIAETYAKSLNLPNYNFSSSGVIASQSKEECQSEHAFIVDMLQKKGLGKYVNSNWGKDSTQKYIDNADLCVFMNQRVKNEAIEKGLQFNRTITLNIFDVNEGPNQNSTDDKYQQIIEETYPKICKSVDDLLKY